MLDDPLWLSKGDAAVFGAVFLTRVRAVIDVRHDVFRRSSIPTELVGDDAPGLNALLLQQTGGKLFGHFGVAADSHDLVANRAILVNRPPSVGQLKDEGQCCWPDIVITTSSRCQTSVRLAVLRRDRRAWSGLSFAARQRMVSYETMIPRCSSMSSTRRRLSGKRTGSHTAWAMISGGKSEGACNAWDGSSQTR
jgi:hypothetical protein